MSEINVLNLVADLNKTIHEHGYENLYYVLFDEDSNLPWAIHLYYKNNKFIVNSRDDRSYIIGKSWEFENYEEAKLFFLNLMESFIEINRFIVHNGDSPYYSCSLWDK